MKKNNQKSYTYPGSVYKSIFEIFNTPAYNVASKLSALFEISNVNDDKFDTS